MIHVAIEIKMGR